jgi:hypothetical protein
MKSIIEQHSNKSLLSDKAIPIHRIKPTVIGQSKQPGRHGG